MISRDFFFRGVNLKRNAPSVVRRMVTLAAQLPKPLFGTPDNVAFPSRGHKNLSLS